MEFILGQDVQYFLYKSSKHQLRPVLSSGALKIRNFALLRNRNLHENFQHNHNLRNLLVFTWYLACVLLYQIRVIIDVNSVIYS